MDTMVLRWDLKIFVRMRIIKTKPYVLHAEANAITKVAKSNNSSDGCNFVYHHITLYGMCQTDHSKRNPQGGFLRQLS